MATGSSEQPPLLVEKQIYSQKFRYFKDGRKGLRNRDKDFMSIRVTVGLGEAAYDTVLVCVTDCLDGVPKLHPNGLQGESCADGVFQAKRRASGGVIRIPHLQIERTKKKCELQAVLEPRMQYLPPQYQDDLRPEEGASTADFDTNKVRLLVFVCSPDGSQWYWCCSDVISNEKENSKLEITRLCHPSVSASSGGSMAVFTASEGPDISPDDFELLVEKDTWQSEVFVPEKDDIDYKRVIHYKVPPYRDPNIISPVTACIVLRRRRGDQEDKREFTYIPNTEGVMEQKKRKTLSPEVLRISGNMPCKIPRLDAGQPDVKPKPGMEFLQPAHPLPLAEDEPDVKPLLTFHQNKHAYHLPSAPLGPPSLDHPSSSSTGTYPVPPIFISRPQPLLPSISAHSNPPATQGASSFPKSYPCTTHPGPAHPHLNSVNTHPISPLRNLVHTHPGPAQPHLDSIHTHPGPAQPHLDSIHTHPGPAQPHLDSIRTHPGSAHSHAAPPSHLLLSEHQFLPPEAQPTEAHEDLLALAIEVIGHEPEYGIADQDMSAGLGGGVVVTEGGGQHMDAEVSMDSQSYLSDFDLDAFAAEVAQVSGQKE